MDLRAKLRESLLAGSLVTKLSVFDFDGTLI